MLDFLDVFVTTTDVCVSHFGFCVSVGDDEETGVEWTETGRQEELAYAWDVVVHSVYVSIQTLLGTCCRTSSGRSDADSSLGSTRWFSRISCTSGV